MMTKWKNQEGVELDIGGMTEVGKIGSAMNVVQEVVQQAIKILSTYNHFDENSKDWAIMRCKTFLQDNFDIKQKRGNNDDK